MITTRYVTGDGVGVITLVATAVDPEGNPITQQTTITVNPSPAAALQTCYKSILALGALQNSAESACAQFGAVSTYYVGGPNDTVYSTDSCSELVGDGFYKTEDGNWVNINGGIIKQRGLCSSVGVRRIRGRIEEKIAKLRERAKIPVSIRGQQTDTFIPQPSFTEASPTTVPPEDTLVPESTAATVQQITPDITDKFTEVAPTDPKELIKKARELGIRVRLSTTTVLLADINKPTTLRVGSLGQIRVTPESRKREYDRLRREVQEAIDKRARKQ